jgi:hypothetical protein
VGPPPQARQQPGEQGLERLFVPGTNLLQQADGFFR